MMSRAAVSELVATLRPRYLRAGRGEKKRILDELVATTQYHRKYAIALLRKMPRRGSPRHRALKRKYQGPAVAALEKVWRIANCIRAKRLVPVLGEYVAALEHHGELKLDAQTRELLLEMSPATADRLLKRIRQAERPHGLCTAKPGALLKHSIPIRTFAQWDGAKPGFTEVDLVAHCGDSARGEYLHSLDMVDIATRWVELAALPNRGQASVSAAIANCQNRLPHVRSGFCFHLLVAHRPGD